MTFFSEGDSIGWTNAMHLPRERSLRKNTLLGTIRTLTKEWRISFELKAENYNQTSCYQVLHLTTGGKVSKIGDRTPALWMCYRKKSGVIKVFVKTALNGEKNQGGFSDKKPPSIGEWSKVEISQVRKRNPLSRGPYYVFSLVIGGEIFMYEENNNPTKFSNVKVYASSPWYSAQAGSIRGLKIEIKETGEPKN